LTLPGRTSPRLDRITLDIPRGITAILGASGAGKTSLLNVLVGFEREKNDSVVACRLADSTTSETADSRVDEPANRKRAPHDHSIDVFWSPPDHGLWPRRTVREHLCVPDASERPGHRCEQLLDAFALGSLADAYPDTLSLGERSRLSVARAVASGAAVLALDEPFAHVNTALQRQLWDALFDAARKQRQSIIFATHQPQTVLAYAEHLICLAGGNVLATGKPHELYHQPPGREVAELFGPCNWLSPDEIAAWLPGASSCVRPEQLAIESVDASNTVVQEAAFCGDHEEVLLRREPNGPVKRFLHRPSMPQLRSGLRVSLRLRTSH